MKKEGKREVQIKKGKEEKKVRISGSVEVGNRYEKKTDGPHDEVVM